MKNNNLRLCEYIKEVVFESFENGKIEKINVKKNNIESNNLKYMEMRSIIMYVENHIIIQRI